jgi:2-oxo-3-hexenedioate decarboxylase
MVQMGLETPVFGVLMGDTCIPDGDVVEMSRLIHPKVEAEIAFVTSRAVGRCLDRRSAGCDGVRVAGHRGDRSRFKDFKFDIQSVIADNTSAARYVVGGSPRRPDGPICGCWAS